MSSLRTRTAVAFALLSAAVVVVFSVVVYRAAVDQRADQLRDLVTQRARLAASVYDSTGALVDGATVDDPLAPADLRAAVRGGQGGSALVDTGGARTEWGAAPVRLRGARGVYVRASAAADERALRDLRDTLILAGLAIVAGATLVGTLLAVRLSSRLRRAAGAARSIAGGDLGARIDEPGRDEVAALGAAVDAMADTLGARLERERRFSADVAHELRTPVAGLVAAAALLPAEDEAAAMVRERAARLRRLVEDLLEIARLESGRERAEARPVDLRALADEVAGRYAGVEVSGAGRRETDPRRLERVLVNLVENAVAHGAPPVEIAVSAAAIVVTDGGPGFPDEPGEAVTDRFVSRGEGGYGLGLTIAVEQARVIGARLETGDGPDGGARVAIGWPA
jgi:signal transduction histidine kinase